MKITLCNGGLGNQTFQYIFSRFVELEGGEPCYLDNAGFCKEHVAHNGFEIPKVFPDARVRLLSDCFTEDVWQHLVERGSIPRHMKEAGEDFALIAETGDFDFDGNVLLIPANQYLPDIAHAKGNIYYHGYWINREWLKGKFWKIIKKELRFAAITDDWNRYYEEEIEQTNSVALHVRRGDFIRYGWAEPAENYRKAVQTVRDAICEAHFFVFSDDLPWCRENMEALGLRFGEVTFVEGNIGNSNYIDMQLMSYCKNMALVARSSFSFLAALLNRNEIMYVYNSTDRNL